MADVPASLLRWAPAPRTIRYARCGTAGAFALPRVILEEHWGDPTEEDGWLVYRRTTRQVSGGPRKVVEDALVGYGPGGLVDLGVFADGVLSRYEPPQVVLPADPVVGARWASEHRRGDRTSKRTCEVIACPTRKENRISVAEIRRPDGVLVLRTHFAEGEGWAGYEALVQAPNQPTVRTWSEAVSLTLRS